jgi:superfamily II DNA or RNA helicase
VTDHGPLFGWAPKTVRTVEGGRGRSTGDSNDYPVDTDTSDRPFSEGGFEKPTVRTVEGGRSENLNDSADRPPPSIPPLTGGGKKGRSHDSPNESSAALTLRSQRTDSGEAVPSAPLPIADRQHQIQAPIGIAGAPPTLRGYQVDCIAAIEKAHEQHRRVLIVCATGTGKAQPIDEPVLTPYGWRAIGEINVGDDVIGADGGPTRVTGVFPQGSREMFRVKFSDGAETICDGEHLWAVRTKSQRHRGSPYRVLTLNAIVAEGLSDGRGARHFIPMTAPVCGHGRAMPLDPYLLGILLGDGGLSIRGQVRLHTEHELAQSLELPFGTKLKLNSSQGPNHIAGNYAIRGPLGPTTNPVMAAIRELGLEGTTSHTKFIPERYLRARPSVRLALLQGLLDADGHVSPGNHVEFTSVSSALAVGVIEIVRSLGGVASARMKRTSWTHKGVKKYGQAVRVTLRMPGAMCPFRWEKKARAWHPSWTYQPARGIVQVTPVGSREAVCISVAAADRLYVTRDYIVTHNTVMYAEWCRRRVALDRVVIVIAHRTELLEQGISKLRSLGLRAELEQADKRASSRANVIVASVQTLKGKRLAALIARYGGDCDVVIDEAHHTAAKSYRDIADGFTGLVLGVTATPDRGDGAALGEVFDVCAFTFDIRDAVAAGFLVPIRARQIHVAGVDLSDIKSRAGDLAQDQLAKVMAEDEAVIGVVDPLLREAGDRRTIVFAVDVAHATAIATAIRERRPHAARVGHGDLSREERAELLADFRRGDFQFLINCQLYTEGFDEPTIACVATARPTKSRALVVQCVGRGTRLLGLTIAESIANGKPDLLWLDFTGNAGRHKLIGPIDALAAGEVPDDVRQEAERILEDEAMDLDEALEEAARRLEERRAAARKTANARYFATDVDPFFGDELGEPCTESWANDPATQEDREKLIHLGFKKLATSASCTKGEATRVLNACDRRSRLKLCSYKQVRALAKIGIDAKNMSKASAGARISVLANNGDWTANEERTRRALQAIEASEIIERAREDANAKFRALNGGST